MTKILHIITRLDMGGSAQNTLLTCRELSDRYEMVLVHGLSLESNMSDSEIRREWNNIDILIISPGSRIVCAIENKIETSEHANQLYRYSKTVSEYFKDYRHILIYLTPEGDYPSDKHWIPYSYNEISSLLERFCDTHRSSMGNDVHTLINHYVTGF